MSRYLLSNKTDCGPASIAAITDLPLAQIKRLWKWPDYNDARDDLFDSPWKHFDILTQLGLRWKYRTDKDISRGKCKPGKTVVLIHGQGLLGGLLQQHYIVYRGRDPITGLMFFEWGDDKPYRKLTADDLEGYYSRGAPDCAYEVVETGGHTKIPWYMRGYVWLTGKFV